MYVNTRRVTTLISAELHEDLKRKSSGLCVTVSAIIREMSLAFVENRLIIKKKHAQTMPYEQYEHEVLET